MKKTLLVVLLSLVMGTASLSPAFAGWWGRGPEGGRAPGAGPGNGCGPCACRNIDDDLDKGRLEFQGQSRELRQQLRDKKGAYRELLSQDSPDKEEAAKLWSEIFDLQGKIRKIAATTGFGPGKGCRQDDDPAPCEVAGGGNGPRGCGGPRGCEGPRGGYGPRGGEAPGMGCGRGCRGPVGDR